MVKQTYANYHGAYYHRNRERITERTREYKKQYNKEYYQLNRTKILAENRRKAINKFQKALLTQNL
jgi:hypothetical protein